MSEGIVHTPHSAGCRLAAQGRSEYIVYDGYEMRDRNGVKYKDGRGDWWHRFKCNDTGCDSAALVRWDVLMEFVA
jgi:hypothetical protein